MKELYGETDKVSGAIDELWQEDQRCKQELAKLWERCAAFANGNQHIVSANAGVAQVSGSNFYVSNNQDTRQYLYTTNEIEPIVRTLVSYMTKAKPGVEVFASDKTEQSKMRAELGEKVLNAKYDLDGEQEISRMAAHYALVFGSCFRKDFWDMSNGSDYEIPVFDNVGNETIDPETDQVAIKTIKTGDSNVALITPLSMSFDWSCADFEQIPWVMESYMMPVEWVKEVYDVPEKGYTGRAKDVGEDIEIGNSLRTLEQLKYATPFSFGSNAKFNTKGRTLVVEMYCQPCSSHPRGRLIVKAGGLVVYDSEQEGSPYYFGGIKPVWHPYTMFVFQKYIGRLLGKGAVEGLIPQQMRLNEINGAILHNANTLAKVDILAAENQLKRGIINGAGGNVYTYRNIPGAPPPSKWPGVPLPQQFFKEKQDLIEQMVREAGTNFVMQGTPPSGVSAASAIEQLLENASSQQSDMMIAWEKFHEHGFTKKLRIIRNFNKLPNTAIVEYLRTLSRDALELEIKAFVGEDLGDGLTLKIEAGSMIPKSEKVKKDLYMTFAKEGLLGPVGEDSPRGARLRKELLNKFGEKGFDLEESADVEKAYWEDDRMIQGLKVEVWDKDSHPIHLSCHISKAKDPKFLERASDEVKQAFMAHIQEHEMYMQQAQMAQMQQQMMAQGGQPMAKGRPQQKQLPPRQMPQQVSDMVLAEGPPPMMQ